MSHTTDAEHDYRIRCARYLAHMTMEHLPTLPLSRQLLACDALADALAPVCHHEATAARAAADALRRAEACQMVFTDLLRTTEP